MTNPEQTQSPKPLHQARWWVAGDLDGFFGLALDNFVQLLLIDALCRFVLGFSTDLIYGKMLPGVALSLAVGNILYALQAHRLASESQRSDVCALPYGINTVSLFAHVFLVMLPALSLAKQLGLPDPEAFAYRAGLWATIGSGLIELGGAPIAGTLRRLAPRAALLSTLAGIALGFISLGFLFRTFAHPLVGLLSLGVILLTYFGKRRFALGLPGGLIAVLLGTLVAWLSGIAPTGAFPQTPVTFYTPKLAVMDWFGPMPAELALSLVGIVIPMGLFNLIGSLQNIESAEAAGDGYPVTPSLSINGAGTLIAAALGSCFPTTIYIGHPGWKAMGARAGYSIANAVFFCVIALTGTLGLLAWAVPVDAGMAIVLWIGIVISAQAFQSTPRAHAPAVVVGLLPGVGAWGALMLKAGLRAAKHPIDESIVAPLQQADVWVDGAFSLEQGFIFTAMLWSAATVCLIERKLRQASLWMCAGALLSLTGLIHSFQFTGADSTLILTPNWKFALAYLGVAALFAVAPWISHSEAHAEALDDSHPG